MSSRQLRKLQKQRELESVGVTDAVPAEESEDDLIPISQPGKARTSLFAALGGEDDDKDEDEDTEGNEGPSVEQLSLNEDSANDPTQTTLKTKKKGKKKKRKTKKAQAAAEEAEELEAPSEDEIDKAMKELRIERQEARSGNTAAGTLEADPHSLEELLRINLYHLKAINEMRNLFGREIIESAEAEADHDQGHRQRREREVDLETYLRVYPGAKKLPEVTLRRNIFVQGKDHWPMQPTGGLKMVRVEKPAHGLMTEYAFEYDQQYQHLQLLFFMAVQTGEPRQMIPLVREQPYHISTLIQMSLIARDQEQNLALSSELIERALFTFGRVATSDFRKDLELAQAYVNFQRPENRQLWLAGYYYIRSLMRKGIYRTALEWSKMLLSLDWADPYGMKHFIHVLAVKAHESKWLIDFLKDMDACGDTEGGNYIRQSAILGFLQLGDESRARDLLTDGIKRLPWLYSVLFKELGLDAPPSIWGHLPSQDGEFWTRLYISQTKDMWNNAQATTLLQDVAKGLEKVDTSGLPTEDLITAAAARLAFLSGDRNVIGAVPRHLLDRQPNYDFDPLPPPFEANVFTNDIGKMPWQGIENENSRESSLLNELRQRLQRRQADVAARAAAGDNAEQGFAGEEPSTDDEIEPGVLQRLINLLGGGGGMAELANVLPEDEDGEEAPAQQEPVSQPGGMAVPGAFPEDEDTEDETGSRRR